MSEKPTVSLGLPVYNGEEYLTETLDSILGQTFADFELIISDNDSTDRTEAICLEYAARDSRIRYIRNPENVGASENYNQTFRLAKGRYFKWCAHDDLLASTFLECCVGIMDAQPDVVLCYTLARAIDAHGDVIKDYPGKQRPNDEVARFRFYEFVLDPHPVVAVFGLMRSEVLGRTRLIGKYSGSDRPLLSEMSLLGKFYEVPEYLFFYRHHEKQSWGGNKSAQAQQAWYDPRRKGQTTFPQWRLMWEHVQSINRSPVGVYDRISCYAYMGYWARKNWRRLGNNLLLRDVV